MSQFYIVFISLFPKANSLQSIRDLLNLRIASRDLYEFTESIDEYIYELIKNITTVQCNVINPRQFLVDLDLIGRTISDILKGDCVIAGSYALMCYMKLKNMSIFRPGDIDVYVPKKQYIDFMKRYQNASPALDSNNYKNISNFNKHIIKGEVIHKLRACRRWKTYDWDSILEEHDDSWTIKPFISDTQYLYLDTKQRHGEFRPLQNIIQCNMNPNDLSSFAIDILSKFDMKQCTVAIDSIVGTFYPHFILGAGAEECIHEMRIKFNKNACFSGKAQLRRLKKYMDRGFGLVTNPNMVY